MARGGGHPTPADHLDRTRAAHKKKTYQTVLESVIDKKKILNASWTFKKPSPEGYTYVRTSQETSRIIIASQERCRLRGLPVYQYSNRTGSMAKAQANPNKIAFYATPIGYHLPTVVITEVCEDLGYTWSIDRTDELHLESGDHGHRTDPSQEATREEIMRAIHHHVPKIPPTDVDTIINHAFKKGENRVGEAGNLSLIDRVNLAVQAHIRHIYTDYDYLLKSIGWEGARQESESRIVEQLKKWRNLDDNGEPEEGFREVLVIEDDDAESRENEVDRSGLLANTGGHGHQQLFPSSRGGGFHGSLATAIFDPGHASTRVKPLTLPANSTISLSSSYAYENKPQYEHGFRPVVNPQSTTTTLVPVERKTTQQVLLHDGVLYNLQPVEPTYSSSRTTTRTSRLVEHNSHRAQLVPPVNDIGRSIQGEYKQPTQQGNSLHRASPHRAAPSAIPRRLSEQDIVLPSVERDNDNVLHPMPAPDSRRDRDIVEARSLRTIARRYSPDDMIDLTSSPRQKGGRSGANEENIWVQSRPKPHDVLPLYAHRPPRESPRRGLRGAYYEDASRDVRPAHIPESHRTTEFRYAPVVSRTRPIETGELSSLSYPVVVETGHTRSGQRFTRY
ncbi:uncharacterized protein BDR25DRAFT_341138 [Lindgomyces ingoldianus]|uniref:Uncharacterized protein n=1 Tax=Lindgomyces ingoldianus TaxID=673940 RepID=A0ACB6R630_9PLEO|nr:uncharacterized protein BDR25DRAFT_341138 [Lindgomyces ingoldianus]KAF2473901.1 hypothetical protein BDR25DRAFT_341138 [Lindgomyces ingoldianus]